MKLFLSSQAISPQQAPSFFALAGKRAQDVKFALVENAADTAADKRFVLASRRAFRAAGLQPAFIDLRELHGPEEVRRALWGFDVLWLGGGNTFYLRWLIRASGLEQVIRPLVEGGLVYAGGSAGAIVAGPTLKHFEAADDPGDAPEVIEAGLGLIDGVPVPHYRNATYAPVMEGIKAKLEADGFETMPMTDAQAVVIDGAAMTVVPY